MEAFTSGKVSAAARRAFIAQRPNRFALDKAFTPTRDGYTVHGWESEIAICRAMGRGVASGNGLAPHRLDKE